MAPPTLLRDSEAGASARRATPGAGNRVLKHGVGFWGFRVQG